MFSITLRNADHVRRYSIWAAKESGWEVTLEEDREVRHQCRYGDWHRVERALAAFQREVSELTAGGWQQIDPSPVRTETEFS